MARLLSFGDARLPADLIPPAADNPAGFWESRSITDLNERILKTLGRGWDDPFPKPLPRTTRQWDAEARQALCESYTGTGSIVIKDPRISLLAPLWIKLLRSENYTPSAILMFRPIEDIVASLTARDGMPVDLAWLLCARYMVAAELNTRGVPRAFIDFNALIDRPEQVFSAVIQELSISEGQRQQIRAFIAPALRRHKNQPDFSNNSPLEITTLAEAYAAATTGKRFRRASTEQCAAWLNRLQQWVAPSRAADGKQQLFLRSEILKHKQFEDHLNRGVRELKGEIDRLTLITLDQQAEIQRLTRLIDENDSAHRTS